MVIDHLHNLQMSMNQNASASNNQTGFIAWQDVPVNAPQGGMQFPVYGTRDLVMNGTVLIEAVGAPPAGYLREVTHFSLRNNDNATDTLIVQRTLVANAANSIFYEASQATLANWVYERGIGWKNQSAAGLSL